MITTKIQPESKQKAFNEDQPENCIPVSAESIVANLESVILGLCIRNNLSRFDETNLDSLFADHNRLFIVKDKNCIYPAGIAQDEFSLCLVFNGDELNVCDLKDNYPHIVARLENSWPSLLIVASRIKDTFETSDAAVLINRTSGRIMASSSQFTSITGLQEDTLIGAEYSKVSAEFEKFFSDKKLSMANLDCDEVHLSLLSVSSAASERADSHSKQMISASAEESDRFIDEVQAVGMHVNRFNALLETNLHIAISPDTLDKLESVIAEMTDYCAADRQTMCEQIDSSNIKASLRLLIQSVLMSHRSLAGESVRTEIVVCRDENNDLQIKFDTPTVLEPKPKTKMNDWWQLVGNLSKRIDVRIGELQFTGNSIINRIYLTNEDDNSDDKK